MGNAAKVVRSEPQSVSLATALKQLLPAVMKQWEAEPWDFKVFGPAGLEDLALITVYLHFGTQYCKRVATIRIYIYPLQAEIVATEYKKKPRKFARKQERPLAGWSDETIDP